MQRSLGLFVTLVLTSLARAQWTEHFLQGDASSARGMSGLEIVGGRVFGGVNTSAAYWPSLGSAAVNLNPAGAGSSYANAVSAGRQVGQAEFSNSHYASLWSGTSASWVNLNPSGATGSNAYGISGTHIVGDALIGGISYAALWEGTTFVNLSPSAISGQALGVAGNQQIGFTLEPGAANLSACLWSGSAASRVDLHPAGYVMSMAFATDGNQQGGEAQVPAGNLHAALWTGSAGSFVDLNPSVASDSGVLAVAGKYQVGFALLGGKETAGFWTGTAASWTSLPAQSSFSEATGISLVGATAYISGIDGGRAVVWSHDEAVSEPASFMTILMGAAGLARKSRRSR